MKKVLLIGHGPQVLPSSTHTGFPQLRTWSLQSYLHMLGHDVHTVYIEEGHDTLPNETFDVAVTAGPFASAFAALSLPDNIPLWLDWPSDPRADLHARLHGKGILPAPSEQAFVTMLHTLALRRADAVGVISKRQYWATLSSLLDWEISTAQLQQKIHYTPISFDFPFPKVRTKRSSKKSIALAGSLNSWFDAHRTYEILHDALGTSSDVNIHIYGGKVTHHHDPSCPLHHWKDSRVHHHGWLSNTDFHASLSTQNLGFWMNRSGVEPLLGSRTRALLFAWMGMDIAASCDTELMRSLLDEGLVWDIRSEQDFHRALEEKDSHAEQLFEYCTEHFSPAQAFAPIGTWLSNPMRTNHNQRETLSDELYRLRSAIHEIHTSRTWKWGSRIHRFLKQLSRKS